MVDLPHMAVAWAEGREWHCRRDNALISMPAATEIALQCPEAWRGFRSARHKLVLRADAGEGMGPSLGSGQGLRPWLYFDLERDPLEMKNLAADPAYAAEIAELVRLM